MAESLLKIENQKMVARASRRTPSVAAPQTDATPREIWLRETTPNNKALAKWSETDV
jgi:hypothetical protein